MKNEITKELISELTALVKLSRKLFPDSKVNLYITPGYISTDYIAIPLETGLSYNAYKLTVNKKLLYTKAGKLRANPRIEIESTPDKLKLPPLEKLKRTKNVFVNKDGILVAGERQHVPGTSKVRVGLNPHIYKLDPTFTAI